MTSDTIDDETLDETPAPDDAPVDEPDPPTEALADELADQAAQYDAAQQAERRAEGVDVDGVFDGPYDPVKAMRAITAKNREVQASKREWLAAKEQAADFKKTYDQDVETLSKLIAQYAGRAGEAQPYLKTVTDEERAAETIDARVARLAVQVARRDWHVTPDALRTLEVFDLETLDIWLRGGPGPIMPAIVAKRAHIAGDAAGGEAHCLRCGARLEVGDEPIPAGHLVGLDCVGEGDDPAPVAPVRRRAAKRTRHAPDAEAAAQRSEGRRRSKPHTAPRKRR